MPEVLAFKLRPLVRVQQLGGLWVVSVRPCPEGAQADTSFGSSTEAAAHATELRLKHGWRVRPESFDLSGTYDLPGAA